MVIEVLDILQVSNDISDIGQTWEEKRHEWACRTCLAAPPASPGHKEKLDLSISSHCFPGPLPILG